MSLSTNLSKKNLEILRSFRIFRQQLSKNCCYVDSFNGESPCIQNGVAVVVKPLWKVVGIVVYIL